MKVTTPEISWHAKEAIYSVDIQPTNQKDQPLRLASAGIDSNIRIWEISPKSKSGVTFLSNLSRHEKAVNVVRFSKTGKILASGGDDCAIILWKLSEKDEAPNIFEDESEIGQNVETWCSFKMLRGHLEDINELCWSPDENFMVSGSVDHTAIVWDVTKGCKLHIMTEAKHFIHGVAWDPLGQYIAVQSCDRSLRIYSITHRRVLHNVSKMTYSGPNDPCDSPIDGDETPTVKPQKIFHDETVVRRRLEFSCDGNLLMVPAGCLLLDQDSQQVQINTAYIFTRGCLNKPACVLPGFKQPVTVIRCCPVKFLLRKDHSQENGVPAINLPYRLVFAVASSDTLLLYDTQHLEPFALIGNIHYAAITDISWGSEGKNLVVASRDGFCTLVTFEDNELGDKYVDIRTDEPMETEEKIVASNEQEDTSCENTDKNISAIPENGPASLKAGVIDLTEDSNDTQTLITLDSKENGLVECVKSTDKRRELSKGASSVQESILEQSNKPNETSHLPLKDSDQPGLSVLNASPSASVENRQSSKLEDKPSQEGQCQSLNKESKPRRVQLISLSQESPLSQSVATPKRRIPLTTLSDVPGSDVEVRTKSEKQPPLSSKASPTVANSVTDDSRNSKGVGGTKKPPRRIQLIPVTDNK